MRAIFIDDQIQEFTVFEKALKANASISLLEHFTSPNAAIVFALEHPLDIAFIDVEMQELNGIELAKKLRTIHKDIALVFMSDRQDYAMDSIKLNAAGYLFKPYTQEELRYAIESAMLLSKRNSPRLFARTFGHFDFFVNGKPIMFKSNKAKELMALLIDRQGGTVTTDQIIATLWEDRPNDEATQNLCSKIVKTLQDELDKVGVRDLIISSRGVKRIDTEKFDCDLYELLAGNEATAKIFLGEYLSEYSWAEARCSALVSRYHNELSDRY